MYLKRGRDFFVWYAINAEEKKALFLNATGTRLKILSIQRCIKKRFKSIMGERKNISPHMVRHSFATHILNNGAGIKEVKEILGHASLETTIRYTHFSKKGIKRIVKQYHPRENQLYIELSENERERIKNILINS